MYHISPTECQIHFHPRKKVKGRDIRPVQMDSGPAGLIQFPHAVRLCFQRMKHRNGLARPHGLVDLCRSGDGPAGRKLDFLAQEFNRECNTICSKSNASSVTAIGLEMKVVIDQFREQILNVE